MKQSPILIKLLLSLIGLLGVSTANAQVSQLSDLPGALAVYCKADPVKLTATSTGTTYVWRRYKAASVTGTPDTLAMNTPNMTDTPTLPGYYTYVSVSLNADGCESAVSNAAVIYVLPGINVTTVSSIPTLTKFCTNALPTGLKLTATPAEDVAVTENFAYTYQWYKGASAILNATSDSYTLTAADDSAIGTGVAYTVKVQYVIKNCAVATSTPITFDVIALPTTPTVTITL